MTLSRRSKMMLCVKGSVYRKASMGSWLRSPIATAQIIRFRNGMLLQKIGDMPIDSDGKVPIRYDLRLSASYLVQKYAKNGTVPLTVYRDVRLIDVNLPVLPQRELVIPYLMDKNPRF